MTRPTVILLPPSEGKALDGEGGPWTPGTMSFPELDKARAKVLTRLGPPRHPVRQGPTLPAADRYTGVLYKELDAGTLGVAARGRLDRWVLIVSGMWGLVSPSDPIPHYKLKMSANLAPLGKLSTWWRPTVTAALEPRVTGAIVWDLLPIEHRAAIDWTQLAPQERITVRFVDAAGGSISHWNKLLKGSLVRWIVSRPSTTVADLAGFEHPQGYRLDALATEREGSLTQLTFRAIA